LINVRTHSKALLFSVLAVSGLHAKDSEGQKGLNSSPSVEFVEGIITLRTSEDGPSQSIQKGSALPEQARVFCRDGARLVLRNDYRSLRFMEDATFGLRADSLFLWSGACLLDQRDKKVLRANPFLIAAPEVVVECRGRGSILAEIQTSGGMKVIGLTGFFKLQLPDEETFTELRPGELRFVKPYGRGFGDLVHLNLETLISTAALIHEFPRDVSLETELAKVTLEQIPLVTKRFRARVGDSRTTDTFELKPLPKSIRNTRGNTP
jgi:hypothetical protein